MHTYIKNFLLPSRDPLLDTSSNLLRITGMFLHRERKLFYSDKKELICFRKCDVFMLHHVSLPVPKLLLQVTV